MPEVPTKLDTLLSCLQSLSSTFGAETFYSRLPFFTWDCDFFNSSHSSLLQPLRYSSYLCQTLALASRSRSCQKQFTMKWTPTHNQMVCKSTTLAQSEWLISLSSCGLLTRKSRLEMLIRRRYPKPGVMSPPIEFYTPCVPNSFQLR